MKIPVEIRADKNFIDQVKNLILQKINEILNGEKNVREYLKELVEKYTIRREKKDFEEIIERMIKKEVFSEEWSYAKETFNTFIKKTIERITKSEVKNYIEDVLFKQIQIVLKDKDGDIDS